jgi:hypothetical protein
VNGTAAPGSQSPGGRKMGGKINTEIKKFEFYIFLTVHPEAILDLQPT